MSKLFVGIKVSTDICLPVGDLTKTVMKIRDLYLIVRRFAAISLREKAWLHFDL